MKNIKLDAETLVVMTFATEAPQATVSVAAAAVSAEPTDCTCQPYYCLRWPTNRC